MTRVLGHGLHRASIPASISCSLTSLRSNVSVSSFLLPVSVPTLSSSPITTLLDCGATDNFIDLSAAPLHLLRPLAEPIALHLFDGSPTPSGVITHAISLDIIVPGFARREVVFYLTKLHPLAKLVLGLSWLRLENPHIDWHALTVTPSGQSATPVGRNPSTFGTIPKLYSTDPIQPVPVHAHSLAPPAPGAPYSVASLVDLEPRDFDSTLAALRFALPFYPSSPATWLPMVEDYADNEDNDLDDVSDSDSSPDDSEPPADDSSPVDSPPDVCVIGAAAFSSLMKQGCFWGSLSVSDLAHPPRYPVQPQYCIPPRDRWADRAHQPDPGTVPAHVHQL